MPDCTRPFGFLFYLCRTMNRLASLFCSDATAAPVLCVPAENAVVVGAHHRHHHLWEAGLCAGC